MNIISTHQEKHYFLNMCILCRYAWFSQAQSHFMLQIPYNLYRDSKNDENSWTDAPTLGINYTDKSPSIAQPVVGEDRQ